MSSGPRDRFVTVNGLRLRYRDWGGSGAPLLALHGISAHAHWWDEVAPRLAGRARVIALDLRGHGRSEWADPPAYSTRDFASDVRAVIDRLGLDGVTLAGHSMGGQVAVVLAARSPDRIARLVVLDTRADFSRARLRARQARANVRPADFPSRAAALARFRLLPGGSTTDAAIVKAIGARSVRRRGGAASANGAWMYRFDPACEATRVPTLLWPWLPKVRVPTLLLRGEHSIILPRAMAERMASLVPSSRLEEIAGAHHHLTLDAPAAVARTLLAWLPRR